MSAGHASPYAGSWYPGDAAELGRLLDELFERSAARTGGFTYPGGLGFVVPHAGPVYSGTVAAAVYRTLARQRPERVLVIGFPHRGRLRGVAWPEADSISTPLGEVRLDREFLDGLGFPRANQAAVCDHSAEIQLPFLQRAVPRARVALLYTGTLEADRRRAVAAALAAACTPGTVLVASSDFTHFGRGFGFLPFAADQRAPERLRELDRDCIEAAGSLDAAMFLECLDRTRATVCGRDPVALLLETVHAMRGDGAGQVTLDYQTSGELTGEWGHSVSYAALGHFPLAAFALEPADRAVLLDSAEGALARLRLEGRHTPEPARGGSGALEAHRGVFVSLHRGGRLLGCIGRCGARQPLSQTVPELALEAAVDDPRFRPGEALHGKIEVEISVLGPMRRIRDSTQVQPGRHGVYLEAGAARGLLLPQVAAHRGWSAVQFLEAVSQKAELKSSAWRDRQVRLSVFEAQVFSRQSL